MDISGEAADIHMRTDANNLVTTAATTKLPEQQETIHMLNCVRQESQSGSIQDLAHVATQDMLADCLTKKSVQPDNLIRAVERGELPQVDCYPYFRDTLQHKAFASDWIGMPQLAEALIVFAELGLLSGNEQCLDSASLAEGDTWAISGQKLIRYHRIPRSRKFKPRIDDPTLPIDSLLCLSPIRITRKEYLDGDLASNRDVWTGVAMDTTTRPWIGHTEFRIDGRPPGRAGGLF